MTNKQKVKEIIGCKGNCRKCVYSMISTDDDKKNGCLEMYRLKEMAEWKEQQILNWLEDSIDLYLFINRDFNLNRQEVPLLQVGVVH